MKSRILIGFIGLALIAGALLIFLLLQDGSSGADGGTEGIPSSATLPPSIISAL